MGQFWFLIILSHGFSIDFHMKLKLNLYNVLLVKKQTMKNQSDEKNCPP
jgi:hypothetical protein